MVIDLHAHYYPQSFLEAIATQGGPYGATVQRNGEAPTIVVGGRPYGPVTRHFHDMKARLKEMDKARVDVQAISLCPPMVYWADTELGIRLARLYNDELASELDPDRMVGLATLPLQDVEASVAELERAVKTLGMRGAAIGSNVKGKDLDHPDFVPFFQKAEAVRAMIFIHPIDVIGVERIRSYYLHNGLGNPFDTAVAAARMMMGGLLDRFPRLQICLAHGGGALPYLVGRLDRVARVRDEARGKARRKPSAYLRRFHYDTVTHSDLALRYLVNLVGSDRVVIGTDYRFDMGCMDPVGTLKAIKDLPRSDKATILSGKSASTLLRL
jgi:aminocarboxymuconate-semialdehyde decarboxylase